MVVHVHYQAPVVEGDVALEQFVQHLVGNCLLLEVLQEDAHRGRVAEVTILLLETEVRRVQVHDERRGPVLKLLKDVVGRPNCLAALAGANTTAFTRILGTYRTALGHPSSGCP